MKINIADQWSEYTPDYNPFKPSDNGWQKQNQDAFKITNINGVKVFIKRFEKGENSIPGYNFLINKKNVKFSNLPTIYDFVTITENNKSVSYLFQQFLEGRTLAEVLKQEKFIFNPIKFVEQIYSALDDISKSGHWYSDFVEKNIFITAEGNYYLIDLDSVIILPILPCEDSPLLSSVSRDYKIAVFTYWYRDTLNYSFDYIRTNLRGDVVNILELFVWITQVKFYLETSNELNFFDSNLRKAVPKYLLKQEPELINEIFKYCFDNESNQQQKLPIDKLTRYIQNSLFPNVNEVTLYLKNKLNTKRIEVLNNQELLVDNQDDSINTNPESNKDQETENQKTKVDSTLVAIVIGIVVFILALFFF